MVAFMTTHICNIIFFNGIKPAANKKLYKVFAVAALFLLFCFGIYHQLADSMGSLIYPILVYMLLICSSAIMAFRASLNDKTNLIAQLFWFPGMLFFITSDAVLAFNKFQWSIHTPIPHIGLVTMMTYGVAQLLLTKGFQLYFKNKESFQRLFIKNESPSGDSFLNIANGVSEGTPLILVTHATHIRSTAWSWSFCFWFVSNYTFCS